MNLRSGGATLAVIVVLAIGFVASAQDEPIIVGDELVFPPDANIPRYLTETEKKWLETHPRATTRAVTPPPTGPIHCAAEYEPMEGLVITWKSFTTILQQMGAQITTTGNSELYVTVDNATVQSSANSALTSAGANMSRVHYFTRVTDTVWVRDYGPRYVFQGGCRALIDHIYNRPRPNDDVMPQYFAAYKHQAYYQHQLVHGGGNFHLDQFNHSFATELIWNENSGLSHTQIHDTWQSYQNLDTHIFPPFPTSIDSTQHLDMWMQIAGDTTVVISDWPNNVGSTQDVICDNAATYMAGLGYTVYRVPAYSVGGTHYTYTNVAICNNLVLVPSYTNSTVAPHNAEALATWQAAMPGKTCVQINCQAIVTSAGVMHCIVSHVPRHRGAVGPNGGLAPTAYLVNLRGGDVLTPGNPVNIQWISDDDVSVANVDILLSTDGGANYNTTIAAATADDGTQSWTPPNIYAPHARVKIVARDGVGNTGFDASPADFTINGDHAPVVTAQPISQSPCTGGSASFSVTASAVPSPNYQWRRGATNLVDDGHISDSTTASMTISPVSAGDAGADYNCLISNGFGSAATDNVALTVNNGPSIESQPANQTVCISRPASFHVSANTAPAPSFQWYKAATPLSNGGSIAGATSDTLTISPVTAVDAGGGYHCLVTDPCGSTTSDNASLTTFISGSGDGNSDSVVNGNDVQGLIETIVTGVQTGESFCAYDMNADGIVDLTDVDLFVTLLLQ